MAAVTRMKGGPRPRRNEDPGGRDRRRGDGARQRAPRDAAPGWSRGGRLRARRGAARQRSTMPASSRWASPGSASAPRARSTPRRARSFQVANIDGWDDAVRRSGRRSPPSWGGPCRSATTSTSPSRRSVASERDGARLVPRRLLGHGRRRRHRDGRQAARRARLGRRDRPRLLEARRPPLQLRARGLRRGLRRPVGARGARPRARQGAPDGAVRADGEARAATASRAASGCARSRPATRWPRR